MACIFSGDMHFGVCGDVYLNFAGSMHPAHIFCCDMYFYCTVCVGM